MIDDSLIDKAKVALIIPQERAEDEENGACKLIEGVCSAHFVQQLGNRSCKYSTEDRVIYQA